MQPVRNRPTRRRFAGVAVLAAGAIAFAVNMTSCTTESAEPLGYDDYIESLETICTTTTDQLVGLPSAPEQIAVADLATSAAQLLEDEATRADRLDLPAGDDVPLDDLPGDHRAFVRNTQEQAAAWRTLAEADDLAPTTELIAQLVGGRNELVRSMGAAECVRGGL